MKRLITILVAATATLVLTAQEFPAVTPIEEIDLLVGESQQMIPAGPLLTGMTVEEGEDILEVTRVGYMLIMKGKRAGDAKLRLDLRAGKTSTLVVHVKSVHVRPNLKPGEPEPERPEWKGVYELHLPADHYSIIYHSFNKDGRERMWESYSCLGGVYVEGESFESEDGYDGMEHIVNMYDFNNELGYSGGLMPNGHYKMFYGDGNEINPDNIRDAKDWFEMYAPESLAFALHKSQDLTDFGRDNNGDDNVEPGVVMQRLRQMGQNQSYLKRYYRGDETVCGVKCWVFDFRSTGVFGGYRTCWWIDPATGLALRAAHEDGSGFIVTRFDLDYNEWDIMIRPELFE